MRPRKAPFRRLHQCRPRIDTTHQSAPHQGRQEGTGWLHHHDFVVVVLRSCVTIKIVVPAMRAGIRSSSAFVIATLIHDTDAFCAGTGGRRSSAEDGAPKNFAPVTLTPEELWSIVLLTIFLDDARAKAVARLPDGPCAQKLTAIGAAEAVLIDCTLCNWWHSGGCCHHHCPSQDVIPCHRALAHARAFRKHAWAEGRVQSHHNGPRPGTPGQPQSARAT